MNTTAKFTFKTAPRRELENYFIDAYGYSEAELEDYTSDELRGMIRDAGEIDLFMGYAA